MTRPVIASLAYSLGESAHLYSHARNFHEMLKENGYPDRPEIFGWGKYRKTAGDIFDLGITSARKTITESGIPADEIDFVYFCSTCFPGDEIDYIRFNNKIIESLHLRNAFPIGVTLNNCTSFLSAISLAANMVRAGCYCNILVITADKVYDEATRFNNFALLSDAAASCIVTSRHTSGYELVADRFLSSTDPINSNKGKDDSELYKRVLAELIEKSDTELSKIRKVFCNNIFRPITQLKEMKLGFSREQIFLDNVEQHGHCFSADTVINLVDYGARFGINDGDRFMVSADAPNLRASMVLKRIA